MPRTTRPLPASIVPNWSDIRFFLETARTRSHTAAARRLGVEHTTVARRLQRLAREYGSPLLERAREGWILTEAGRRLMAHAETMEAAALAASEDLAAHPANVAGTVRLGVPEVLGARVLTPRLPPLLAKYPDLHIELLLLPRSPSLAAREADLTVTLEPPRIGRYYVTRLALLRYDLYGSPEYLAQHPLIAHSVDLAGHRFVDYVQDYLLSESLRYLDELGLSPRRVFTATGMQAQFEAIRCGLGIGMLARYLIDADSPLIRVLPSEMWIERELWLAAPIDMFALRRVRVVWDFLRGIAEAEPGLFGPDG